jgi:hypothetical protein
MALRLDEPLTPASALAYSAIQRGVREGLSIESIGRAVRGGGIRIANDALRSLVTAERGIFTHGQNLRFVNLDSRPNIATLPQALTAIRRAASFTVEVRGTLLSSGQSFIQHVTVTTDTPLTRREIEEAALDAVEGAQDRYGIEVEETLLVRGVRAGLAGRI